MRLARGLLTTTFLAMGLATAHAADYLRGPIAEPSYGAAPQQSASYDWSGFYVGGNYALTKAMFRNSGVAKRLGTDLFPHLTVTDQIADMTMYTDGGKSKNGYGVFVGYNTQWDDVVLGVEAEYGRMSITRVDKVSPIARQLWPDGNTSGTNYFNTYIDSGAITNKASDFGVARFRAGWAYGRFMPYMTAGIAAVRLDGTGTISGRINAFMQDADGNWIASGSQSATRVIKDNGTYFGYALGAGLDWAVIDNVFVRGQWEYISVGGSKSTQFSAHTAKVGAGVKF